jgi:PLAT/LH2 domain
MAIAICSDWVATPGGGPATTGLLTPSAGLSVPHVMVATVTTQTSTCKGASTDSDIVIRLYGKGISGLEEGLSTPWSLLPSTHNSFERGRLDDFNLRLPDVGTIHALEVSAFVGTSSA